MQSYGTDKVGWLFAPIAFLWFLMMGGVAAIEKDLWATLGSVSEEYLKALNSLFSNFPVEGPASCDTRHPPLGHITQGWLEATQEAALDSLYPSRASLVETCPCESLKLGRWVAAAEAIPFFAIFDSSGPPIRKKNGTSSTVFTGRAEMESGAKKMYRVLVLGDVIDYKTWRHSTGRCFRLLKGDPLKLTRSSLTGESLPVTKGRGDGVYSALHANKVLTAIGNFCICSIAVGMIIEIIVMYPIQDQEVYLILSLSGSIT
ncbi:hypothetical protein IFM89_000016 [Coptis chinensis]|uniref:Uncharacterized protein n=1 Tax=Coptis chinensis TaxID=261450 RepID=A0A835IFL3_9MAGN|nr:hypothetical protein IFM89_000016 [Coptis chinensis]